MNRLHGGVRSGHPPGLIDFSSNLNPWGPPEGVRRLFQRDLLREIIPYPDPAYPDLRMALEHYTGCPSRQIFPANGSEEIFFWICLLLKPREVLVINPTYGEYAIAAQGRGSGGARTCAEGRERFHLMPGRCSRANAPGRPRLPLQPQQSQREISCAARPCVNWPV